MHRWLGSVTLKGGFRRRWSFSSMNPKGVLWLLFCVSARADVLVVSPAAAPFTSIPAALRVAKPGDTLQIQAATYVGNLTLDKTVVLEGIGKPVLRGSGDGSVLTILAPHCVVQGLIIEHSGSDLQKEDSGILLKSAGNRVEDNDLRDVLYGIYLYQSRGNAIRRNAIQGRKELEIGERGAGLHLWDSPSNIIEENIITETRDGLYIQSSPDNTIRRNRVTHLRYGVHYMFSDSNTFEANLFSENVAGAAIMYSSHIVFRHNAFVHNRGFSSFGILFQECGNCYAEENFIVDNEVGIFMEALHKSIFRRNVIGENDVALQIFSSSDENTFTENNFVENLSPLYLIGKRTTTHWESHGRGNFWSDYEGHDLDANGIGDVPHKVQNVFEFLEGNYPRLRLYLESPAAQGLAIAEKAFPIIQGSMEIDEAPLAKAVKMAYPFQAARTQGHTNFELAVTSSLLVLVTIFAIWRAQRRLQ
jgi:nitrous oxidase accessory protein